ncbi:ribonuclease H, partial [Trifolium pratense]
MIMFKDVSILSWNVRGANNPKTKSEVAVVDAQGQSGGVWILKQIGVNFDVHVVDVYLNTITISIATGPWCIMGDFNEIIAPGEQRGGNFHPNRAAGLSSVMNHCNLLDLNSVGGKFTWHRNCRGQRSISKKLDRGMANVTWRLNFPEAFLETLCRVNSDHNPILLRCGGLPIARGARPFRFEAAWISHSDYEQLVKNAWTRERGLPIAGLNTIREDSILFNKEVFGNIFKKKRKLENRLNGIQRVMERVDSTRLILLEQQLQKELDDVLYQEELLWFQKSREKWIKFGDRNTKFFHAQTVIRRKRNKIHGITLPCGAWCTDDTILQEEAKKIFKNLFAPPNNSPHCSFDVAVVPKLDAEQVQTLLHHVSKEEVFIALNQMHPLKAPGPDGFQGVFFRQYWHILGNDICDMVSEAFATGQFNPSLAETLICLIPKEDCPKHFKDFRPISLCNTLYKLITKILVNRLRPMLDSIVGPFQSSFLPGRGTSDNAIILQEVIYNMNKSKAKKGDVAYKIDLEKAYDNVDWNYLRSCLHDFGFPPLTIKLIMHCVCSSTLSLIWNGQRLPSFSPTRGLRQGDPLSPYLFVLCMEKLSLAISEAVQNNSWKPIQISKNGPRFSHLFFADDVLLFSKATCSQGRIMANLFNNFSKASGLKINCAKSRALFSKGVPRRKMDKLTSLSGIRSTNALGKYLGFPMITGRVRKDDYHFILDKLNSRLASWKNKFLNKPGRVTLAKSVLNSIPTYYMQISWLPSSICSQIDQLTRNFIWKGNSNNGIHLVGWQSITQTKKDGGLGVRLARETNTAMLGKLVWDIQQNSNKPWVLMIQDKYLSNKIFFSTPRSYGSPIWNSISKAKLALQDGYQYRIGD